MNELKAGVLGVLGGGQLAKMLGSEAYRLGLELAIIENGSGSPAGKMTKLDFGKGWTDRQELDRFISNSTFITLENEFIDPDIISYIEKVRPVYPSSATMRLVRDKFIQKETFRKRGLGVTEYEEIANESDAKAFGLKYGFPFVLKSREMGYDGYGNYTVKNEEEINKGLDYFRSKKPGIGLMAEAFVKFSKELAVMAVRSSKGEEAVYPCVETIQKNHICHTVIAPAQINDAQAEKAQEMAKECVRAIDGIGIFGVEFFLDESGRLLVNEIAPRPHNSGHYTIEGCYTSQFENAIRAITGQPLGSTAMREQASVMVNLLGDAEGGPIPKNIEKVLGDGKVKLHLYGKSKSRIGRKMGHITVTGATIDECLNSSKIAMNSITWAYKS
jgi:5-(carboxyamino)imidazole ribonucleotide synthase